MLTQVRRESSREQRLGIRIKVAVAEHLARCTHRLPERARGRPEVTAFAFDRNHARKMSEHIGEEPNVQSLLGQMECLVAEFVKWEVFVSGHEGDPTA